MTTFVVDASVAIKWLSPFRSEPLADRARLFLERWQQGEIQLAAPDLIWPEIASAHWKAVQQNRCTLQDAEVSLAKMHQQGLSTVPCERLVDEALGIALRYRRTVYDSLYIALAIALNCEAITADEKLVNALYGYLPLKWLGTV
jgi:predicted nucleic acid-binding protein